MRDAKAAPTPQPADAADDRNGTYPAHATIFNPSNRRYDSGTSLERSDNPCFCQDGLSRRAGRRSGSPVIDAIADAHGLGCGSRRGNPKQECQWRRNRPTILVRNSLEIGKHSQLTFRRLRQPCKPVVSPEPWAHFAPFDPEPAIMAQGRSSVSIGADLWKTVLAGKERNTKRWPQAADGFWAADPRNRPGHGHTRTRKIIDPVTMTA